MNIIELPKDHGWATAKSHHFQGIVFGIPTFGMVSDTFMMSQVTMAMDIFTNVGYHLVRGKPVDIARNEIAYNALKTKAAYVFFRDDDTIAPRDALLKLVKRLTVKARSNPYEHGDAMVGGVVYAKTEPPTPMIHIAGVTGGFEDWQINDLVECDVIGMGCTLVPVGVIKRAMEKVTHWRCANASCKDRYSEHENQGMCPTCNFELVPGLFKTVRDKNDDGQPATLTEDSYFCLKAKDAGCKVYADCGVQCQHEKFDPDPEKNTVYYYHPHIGPVWQTGSRLLYYPVEGQEIHEKFALKPRPELNGKGPVKFNLGSGLVHKKGFINVDLYADCDFQCDIQDISPLIRHYGQADFIRAYHTLEHLDRNSVLGTVRSWIKGLKPGGVLEFEVPDGVWAAKKFIKAQENGHAGREDFSEAIMHGLQNVPGEYHKTLFSKQKMEKIVASCSNQVEKSSVRVIFPKNYNQQCIRVKIKKKEAVK